MKRQRRNRSKDHSVNTVITHAHGDPNEYVISKNDIREGRSKWISLAHYPHSSDLDSLLNDYVATGLEHTVYSSLLLEDVTGWSCEYRPEYWVDQGTGHQVISLDYHPDILTEVIKIITVAQKVNQAVFIYVTHPARDRVYRDLDTSRSRRQGWDLLRGR